MILATILLICVTIVFVMFLYWKIMLKNSEIEMLKEHICYDKSDLHSAWNNGFVEGVNSERGHSEKNFHQWYQVNKFSKRYGE